MADSFEERKQKLSERAEALLDPDAHPMGPLSMDQIKVLIHDYQVYQIELELQNEDLRNVQEQLAAARDEFARLYNDVPVGYLTIDQNGTILQANQTFASMVGSKPHHLPGQPLTRFIISSDQGTFHGRFKAFFKNPHAKQLDFTLHGGKKNVAVRCMGNAKQEPHGKTGEGPHQYVLLAVMDINEQVRTEEAMRESEIRFRTLLEDVSTVAIQGYAMDGTTQYWNRASENLYGYTAREAIGQNLLDLIIPSRMREHVQREMQYMAETGRPMSASEMTLLRKDGSMVPVYSSHAVVHKPNSPSELFCMDIDLSDLKHTEEELRRAKQRLEEAQRVGGLGDWDWDPASDVVTWSENLYRLFGLDPHQPPPNYAGQLALYHPEDIPPLDRAVKRSLHQGEPYEIEIRLANPVAVSHVLIKGLADQDENGQVLRLYGSVLDITKRKQAELENEKLQSLLLQAQKMESVGILAGGVAHDFNNLLQVMNGNIQFLLGDCPDDHPGAARLQALQKSIDRGAQLVHQLLLFGRKAEMQVRTVDLNQEVKNAMLIMERTIPRMITISLHLDENLHLINADPLQIEQVLLNLGTNAVQAMNDEGKILIETGNVSLDAEFARMHPGSSPGRYVLLSFTDTGCGMDKNAQSHLFDPFFTTKDVGKGTGLGLASVYGIVKSHNGSILCYSEPDQGTTFKIYLPARGQDTARPCDQRAADRPRETAPQGHGETILVVDDEAELLDLTTEALESLGYKVICARNGEQALEIYMAEGGNIDVILLDLNMPGMGGRKCLQALLRHDSAARVLVVSGYTANGHGQEALSIGAKGFLGKPYHLKEVASMVRKVLDEKPNQTQSP